MSRPVTSCVNTMLRRYLPILNRGVPSTLVKHFPAIVTKCLSCGRSTMRCWHPHLSDWILPVLTESAVG
jgi:hypothetical protein